MSCELSVTVPYTLKIIPSIPVASITSRIFKPLSFSQTDNQTISILRISESLAFKNVISVPYEIADGHHELTYSLGGLIIAVIEDNFDSMVNDFRYQIEEAWKYYAHEKDERLTDNAQRVKRWLLENVTEV